MLNCLFIFHHTVEHYCWKSYPRTFIQHEFNIIKIRKKNSSIILSIILSLFYSYYYFDVIFVVMLFFLSQIYSLKVLFWKEKRHLRFAIRMCMGGLFCSVYFIIFLFLLMFLRKCTIFYLYLQLNNTLFCWYKNNEHKISWFSISELIRNKSLTLKIDRLKV